MTLERFLSEFRIYWIKYPMLRLLIPFVIGILLRDTIDVNIVFIGAALSIILVFQILIHFKIKSNLGLIPWFGLLTHIFIFGMGLFWSIIRNEQNHPDHFDVKSDASLITQFYYVEEKDRFWDCYSNVLFQRKDKIWDKANGKLLIRVSKAASFRPNSRDVIFGNHRLISPDHQAAPYEFDWANLLDHRNIHYITYLDTAHFQILHKAPPSILEKSRSWSDSVMLSVFGNTRDYPVATAMLLGLRKKIDPELYRAYSATGAVHVLAVSGLHVGILAKIIELLFGFLIRRSKAKKFILPGIVIVCIWLYTLLTGATPSILRSALMFSLFIIGRLLQKDAQPLNILAAAAWVVLVINPNDIYNIGFQLSFGAMAGIFILYDPIRVLWPVENKVMQIVWEITAVSLAAQLFIYPIVGYHFHQFAFYFWLTSLVSTPFSYLIIGLGIAIFPIKALGLVFLYWLDYILIYSVTWMNDIIAWLYTMPLGKLKGWWPSGFDCLLLIFISVLIGLVLKKKNFYSLSLLLSAFIFLFILLSVEKLIETGTSEIIASRFRGKSKVWIKNKNSIIQILGDSSLFNSNYVDKYDVLAQDIILLDSIGKICEGGGLLIKSDILRSSSGNYRFVNSRQDLGDAHKMEDASWIILNKYWTPDVSGIGNPSKIYCFDQAQADNLKSFYPSELIQLIKNSFLQLPIR